MKKRYQIGLLCYTEIEAADYDEAMKKASGFVGKLKRLKVHDVMTTNTEEDCLLEEVAR